MTEKEYRASPGISRSELWRLNPRAGGTPEKFLWAQKNPKTTTPAMLLGILAHKALLEPEKFDEDFVTAPDVDRRTKDGKAAWAAFQAEAKKRTVVPYDSWLLACKMAEAANSTPFVKALLNGKREHPIFWTDPDTGEQCKVRLDCLSDFDGTPIIIDYKTTTDATSGAFSRKSANMGYDFQSGMYSEAVEQKTGIKPRFVFIVQETEEPFAVNLFEADDEFIQHGKDIYRELLGIYHECKTTGDWYGYLGPKPVISRLSLPAWATNE